MHDKEFNAYGDDLAIRAMDHSDVINLYKLHKDLCAQIDSGEVTVEDATIQFDYERMRVVDALERGNLKSECPLSANCGHSLGSIRQQRFY